MWKFEDLKMTDDNLINLPSSNGQILAMWSKIVGDFLENK